MYDKNFYRKLIDCDLTFEELRSFFPQNKNEYDLDNSFDKYFNLIKIKNAVTLYKNGSISDKYLANWACAYNWIVMASVWNSDSNGKMNNLKDNLLYAISDWLDGVSFFDASLGVYEDNYLDTFYNQIESMFIAYQNLPDWYAYYTEDTGNYDDEYGNFCVEILCVNDKEKQFFTMCGELVPDNALRENRLDYREYGRKIKAIQTGGYSGQDYMAEWRDDIDDAK